MFGKRNISYNKNTRQNICYVRTFNQACTSYTHTHTHPSPRAPFPPLILPILHLPSLIKGHLLSFLPASPGFSSPSPIGEFLQDSDWPVLSAPPLVSIHENTSPFWGTLLLPLRTASSPDSPPLLRRSSFSKTEKKGVRVPPGGRHVLQCAPCCFKGSRCFSLNTTQD